MRVQKVEESGYSKSKSGREIEYKIQKWKQYEEPGKETCIVQSNSTSKKILDKSYIRSRSLTPQQSQNTVYKSTTPNRVQRYETSTSQNRRSYIANSNNRGSYYKSIEKRETSTNKVTIDGRYSNTPISRTQASNNDLNDPNKNKWMQRRDSKPVYQRQRSLVKIRIL